MLVCYMSTGAYKMSDEEIIQRAENLGMIMESNTIIKPSDTKDDKDSASDTDSKNDTTENITENTTEEDNSEEDTTEITTENVEATTEENSETSTASSEENIDTSVSITVRSGMSSYDVSMLLYNAGVISDYADFDAYLGANGYSTKIEVGEYKFNSSMSYEEIAQKLITGAE